MRETLKLDHKGEDVVSKRVMVGVMSSSELLREISKGLGNRPYQAWEELRRRAKADGEQVAFCHLMFLRGKGGVPFTIKREVQAILNKDDELTEVAV